MTTIVNFTRFTDTLYRASIPVDEGDYVPLAEYQELKTLIQRVVDMKPNLGGNYAWQNEELSQLLKDCKEAIA